MKQPEVQKQLKQAGCPDTQVQPLANLMKARGWSMSDLFTHLPEILELFEQVGDLWQKLSKSKT